VDWWSKYYASKGEEDKCLHYVEEGYDTLQVILTHDTGNIHNQGCTWILLNA